MWTHVCEAWGHASILGGRMPKHVSLSSKTDQLSHLESTTVSRATPLCVLCMSQFNELKFSLYLDHN